MSEIAVDPLLAEAARVLETGDWRRSAASCRAALAERESAEAYLGLATALWCGYEIEPALGHMKTAYRLLRDAAQAARAARVACWIAMEEALRRGNPNVARGWFGRAARLLEEAGACPERNWYAVTLASFEGDLEGLARAAAAAVEDSRRFGDRDLEMLALACWGQALVGLGRVGEGMRLLDEAMAGVVGGEVSSPMTVSDCLCVMVTACELAGDLGRAEEWSRVALEAARAKSLGFLAATCATSYGSILVLLGRHQEAEGELRRSLEVLESGHPRAGLATLVRLADLRRRQGRGEEAKRLLRRAPDSPGALRVGAELALEGADGDRALQLARRAAETARAGPVSERAVALGVLVRAAAARGEVAEAQAALGDLERAANSVGTSLMLGGLWLARGALAGARGGGQESIAAYWEAAGLYSEAGAVFDAAQARLRLA
ncbi:MAG: tetratricopeptide repeat protein, partial [Candidatus Dormibacterales bacterium]